jgi:hypothetical protein
MSLKVIEWEVALAVRNTDVAEVSNNEIVNCCAPIGTPSVTLPAVNLPPFLRISWPPAFPAPFTVGLDNDDFSPYLHSSASILDSATNTCLYPRRTNQLNTVRNRGRSQHYRCLENSATVVFQRVCDYLAKSTAKALMVLLLQLVWGTRIVPIGGQQQQRNQSSTHVSSCPFCT